VLPARRYRSKDTATAGAAAFGNIREERNMTRARDLIGLSVAVVILSAGLVACGGSDDAATTTVAATTAPTEAAGTTIAVELGEEGDSMTMNLDSATAPAGSVTFAITNTGTREHEFVIVKTDTAVADLPFDEAADEITEDAAGLVVVDEIEGIPAGATDSLTVDLEPGHYALVCNIEGHFRLGMRADFDIN
jgi:uncharacterized cupredoxin-like copper-binding protein